MSLVSDGVFTIPLFHGTSAFFAKRIHEVGLGSCNPIDEYVVLPFLKAVYEACDATFDRNDGLWAAHRIVLQPMMQQQVLGSANFQHGHAYLTPCRNSAVGYALSNRWGSELITQALNLYKKLVSANPKACDQFLGSPVLRLLDEPHIPCLVTATSVPTSMLAAEDGGPVSKQIEILSTLWETMNQDGVTFNINFRLIAPLSTTSIKIETLDAAHEVNSYA